MTERMRRKMTDPNTIEPALYAVSGVLLLMAMAAAQQLYRQVRPRRYVPRHLVAKR